MEKTSKKGIVLSSELCKPLQDTMVTVHDTNKKIIITLYADEEGRWTLPELDNTHTVEFSRKEYILKSFHISELPETVRLMETSLCGYQDHLHYTPGRVVSVYVNAVNKYSATLFRYGLDKDKIMELGSFPSCLQKTPDGYFVDSGLKWQKTMEYTIPHNAKPGLYGLELISDAGEEYVIPIVVSTLINEMGKNADILLLANVNTWVSYNLWGGRSRYRSYEIKDQDLKKSDLFKEVNKFIVNMIKNIIKHISPNLFDYIVTKRGKIVREQKWCNLPLSLNRPLSNCSLEEKTPIQPFNNHLAAGEWRILAWLEREGISYDYIADRELHHDTSILKHYKAIVLSTHSEYWSKKMLDNLHHNHNNNGLWILNFSGNSIYGEIEINDEQHSQNLLHPNMQIIDLRISEMLGIRYPHAKLDFGTCAPFKALKPEHWLFNGTLLDKNKLVFGEASLNQNVKSEVQFLNTGSFAQGNEEDYDQNDSSSSSLPVSFSAKQLKGEGASGWELDKKAFGSKDFTLIAKGMNFKGGAHMVVKEPDTKQGGVFSASSITFGGSLLIDQVCSSIAKNAIRKAMEPSKG